MDREERRQLNDDERRDELKKRMHENSSSRVWIGLLLLIAGGLLLARQVGADIPAWLFRWPTLLVAIGLLIGFKSGFKNAGGLIMIVIGAAFLLNEIVPDAHMENFIWPGILIILGIVFILRPRSYEKKYYHKWEKFENKWTNQYKDIAINEPTAETGNTYKPHAEPDAEFIEINSVFGSANKLILSKNFKGGEINAFMGGAEINLLQADIKQPIKLEINAVFGGAKLILPGNWDVKNRITAVFGGVEDKRHAGISTPDPNKIIILEGACVFGGIEIRNF